MPTVRSQDPFRMGAARHLRRSMTKGETIFWQAVRRKQTGYRVRRQYAVGPYVLDFYIHAARICIEIDGPDHDHRHDQARDDYLGVLGIRTIRIPWTDLANRLEAWLAEIEALAAVRVELQKRRETDARHPAR